jgi:hypothetical protein
MTTQPDAVDVEPLGDGRWRATRAEPGATSHVVELHLPAGELRCDCKGFAYRGRCRHVDGIARFEGGEAPTDPAAAFVENAGPGLERDVPPPDRDDFDRGAP